MKSDYCEYYFDRIPMKMNHLFYLIIFVLTKLTEQNKQQSANIGDDFPVLYKIDNYYNCPDDHLFCTISLKLVPVNKEADYWKKIQDWSLSPYHFNRTFVYRTLCIPPYYSDETSMGHYVKNLSMQEMTSYNLSTEIYDKKCMMREEHNRLDLTPTLLVIALHISLVVIATLYDFYLVQEYDLNIFEKVLLCFSLMNYKRVSSKASSNSDSRRLKCMQGIRMLATLSVISGHSLMNISIKNIKNPSYMEEIFESKTIVYLLTFSLVIIQMFFLISSWLLVNQILALYEKQGKFTIRDAILLFTHRIIRIWPTLAYSAFVTSKLYYKYANGPAGFEVYNVVYNSCTNNMLPTFLHITNFFKNFDVCHFGMWSLSLDTQYYVLTIILMYLILNYKLNIKKLIGSLILISYVVTVFQMYLNGIRLDDWVSLKTLVTFSNFNEDKLFYIYFGFWVSYSSSLVGSIFGYADYYTKNNTEPKPYEQYYFYICLAAILSILLIPKMEQGILATALILPAIKLVFIAGVGLSIYAISRNIIQGFPKYFLENKLFYVLANFSYGVYIFHFQWVLSRGTHLSSLVEFSLSKYIQIWIEDSVICFLIGIIVTLMVTLPGVLLGNLILPSVWKKKKDEDNANSYVEPSNKVKSC